MSLPAIHAAAILLVLFIGFAAMAWRGASQALVIPLAAAAILLLAGEHAPALLGDSLASFAYVAIIMTAVATAASQLERSNLFRLAGARLGHGVGVAGARFPYARALLISFAALGLTAALAATLHNITSILVMTPITVSLCSRYAVPSRWLLYGSLVASNLGGFSTAWGDSPNIIERRVWGLSHGDFATQILPLNLVVLAGLIVAVTLLTQRDLARLGHSVARDDIAWSAAGFRAAGGETQMDWRLAGVGFGVLAGFIGLQLIAPRLEIAAAGLAICVSVLGDRPNQRIRTLQALGLDAYLVLAGVFVIGHAVSTSLLGILLQQAIEASNGATWAIAVTSYLGTGLTEAASWAAAAAPATHAVAPGNAAAWALGAGICAGSSSILTAASAGVLLWAQSRRFEGHQVTFAGYLIFGLVASLAMLAFYILAISAVDAAGGFQ